MAGNKVVRLGGGDGLLDLRSRVAEKIGPIEKMFVPEARITVIVRIPSNPRADLIVTSDTDAGIREVMDRLESGETK